MNRGSKHLPWCPSVGDVGQKRLLHDEAVAAARAHAKDKGPVRKELQRQSLNRKETWSSEQKRSEWIKFPHAEEPGHPMSIPITTKARQGQLPHRCSRCRCSSIFHVCSTPQEDSSTEKGLEADVPERVNYTVCSLRRSTSFASHTTSSLCRAYMMLPTPTFHNLLQGMRQRTLYQTRRIAYYQSHLRKPGACKASKPNKEQR